MPRVIAEGCEKCAPRLAPPPATPEEALGGTHLSVPWPAWVRVDGELAQRCVHAWPGTPGTVIEHPDGPIARCRCRAPQGDELAEPGGFVLRLVQYDRVEGAVEAAWRTYLEGTLWAARQPSED